MNRGPIAIARIERDAGGDEDADHDRGSSSASATTSSPTEREPFTRIASPGRTRPRATSTRRCGRGRDPLVGPVVPRRARRRRRTTSRASAAAPPISSWYRGASGPSSAISPRIATVRRPSRALAQVRERGAHRDGVRVPGVVDEQPAARRAPSPGSASARTRPPPAPAAPRARAPRAAVSAAAAFAAWWRAAKPNTTSRPRQRTCVRPSLNLDSGAPKRRTSSPSGTKGSSTGVSPAGRRQRRPEARRAARPSRGRCSRGCRAARDGRARSR